MAAKDQEILAKYGQPQPDQEKDQLVKNFSKEDMETLKQEGETLDKAGGQNKEDSTQKAPQETPEETKPEQPSMYRSLESDKGNMDGKQMAEPQQSNNVMEKYGQKAPEQTQEKTQEIEKDER